MTVKDSYYTDLANLSTPENDPNDTSYQDMLGWFRPSILPRDGKRTRPDEGGLAGRD